MHSPLKVKSWYHCSLSGSHHIRSPSLTCSSDYRVFIVSFDSFCHNERITAHEVTNLGNVFTVLLVRQLEVTQLLSEKIPSDRMRPCKCSLPCCFSWRWCHRLERAGGREGGRFGEDGGGCFWQIASLSRSDRHFQPLSRLFSSLFATSRLSLMPACCEGAAVQKVRSRGVKGTKQKSKATPPPPLSLGRWMKPMRKHAPFFFLSFQTHGTNICFRWCVSSPSCLCSPFWPRDLDLNLDLLEHSDEYFPFPCCWLWLITSSSCTRCCWLFSTHFYVQNFGKI